MCQLGKPIHRLHAILCSVSKIEVLIKCALVVSKSSAQVCVQVKCGLYGKQPVSCNYNMLNVSNVRKPLRL